MPTIPKSKAGAAKEQWEADRARYTWHLRQPTKGDFDSSHWWEDNQKWGTEIDAPGALYELARRHPLVGEVERWIARQFVPGVKCFLPFDGLERFDTPEGKAKWKAEEMSEELRGAFREIGHKMKESHEKWANAKGPLVGLTGIGMRSWATLAQEEQDRWKESLGKFKGVEGRHDFKRCRSLTESVGESIEFNRQYSEMARQTAAWKRGEDIGRIEFPKYAKWSGLIEANDGPEWDSLIAEEAVEAHRQGDVVFALAPDLTLKEAKRLLEREYRKHLQRRGKVQQRARWQDWLPMIAQFEKEEAEKGGAKSATFNRYRRIMDSLQFPTRREPSVTTKQ